MPSWTTMIARYTQNRFVEKALENFKQMKFLGVKPNSKAFSNMPMPIQKWKLWKGVCTSIKKY
jgi:pentatricopeptide repeat protein